MKSMKGDTAEGSFRHDGFLGYDKIYHILLLVTGRGAIDPAMFEV